MNCFCLYNAQKSIWFDVTLIFFKFYYPRTERPRGKYHPGVWVRAITFARRQVFSFDVKEEPFVEEDTFKDIFHAEVPADKALDAAVRCAIFEV